MEGPGDPIIAGSDVTSTPSLDRRTFERLCRVGLTRPQVGLLAACLVGLPLTPGVRWDPAEVERIAFLRWLVQSGRLPS